MNKIPKRFIRFWIGNKTIPPKFEEWWQEFKEMHPTYEFLTIRDFEKINVPNNIKPLLRDVNTCAGVSDIGRILALYQLGGIYIDTDVMPLKPFDELINTEKVFLAKRSSKSFESAVIGSPKNHKALLEVINQMPNWFYKYKDKAASVQTGPTFVSSVLFGRKDVLHLPMETFYPYNGFMAPKRNEKIKMFSNKNNFPKEMICAHFSNHRWGGKPK